MRQSQTQATCPMFRTLTTTRTQTDRQTDRRTDGRTGGSALYAIKRATAAVTLASRRPSYESSSSTVNRTTVASDSR